MKTCNDAPVGYTDHPPVGHWQPWTGGVCPVHPLCVVEYVMRAEQAGPDEAAQLTWTHDGDDWDIVAYRIVEEYKEPEPQRVAREVWLKQWKMVTFNSSGMFFSGDPKTEHLEWGVCSSECDGATLFREVLE